MQNTKQFFGFEKLQALLIVNKFGTKIVGGK